jgi:hypothetical protein
MMRLVAKDKEPITPFIHKVLVYAAFELLVYAAFGY